jgi:hypothetical protein
VIDPVLPILDPVIGPVVGPVVEPTVPVIEPGADPTTPIVDPGTGPTSPVVNPGPDPTVPVVDPTEHPIDIHTPPIYVPAQPGSNPTQPVVPQPAAPITPAQPVVPAQSPATLIPLAPAQIAESVTEAIAGLTTAERTPVVAWTPATDQTVKIDETLQKGTPGSLLQSLVPSTSTSGGGQSLDGSAAPAVVPSFNRFDVPGATFTRAEFDSEIPASISQTVPVPPG